MMVTMLAQPARGAEAERHGVATSVTRARRPGVILVGNFLSSATGVRGVCEDLADQLTMAGWPVLTTSRKRGRLSRLMDMITSVWARRHSYSVAQVDVFSGQAFLWAEAVCFAL